MYKIDSDLTIHITRGDAMLMDVQASSNGELYTFKAGDVVRFKVFKKKDVTEVYLVKDVRVVSDTQTVQVYLTSEETKIGENESKPIEYWYEVELNPDTEAQTIVGYDEDGAKIFMIYPEGGASE